MVWKAELSRVFHALILDVVDLTAQHAMAQEALTAVVIKRFVFFVHSMPSTHTSAAVESVALIPFDMCLKKMFILPAPHEIRRGDLA